MIRSDSSLLAADEKPERGNPLIDALADWLMNQALGDTPLQDVFENTCKQLFAAGIPIARVHISFRVLHPLYSGQALRWIKGQGAVLQRFEHGADVEAWLKSPLFHMLDNQIYRFRRRLTGDSAIIDFELLEELRDQGFTDYLALMTRFDENPDPDTTSGIIGSWCSERNSGFSAADIRALLRIEKRLAVAFKVKIQAQLTQNILAAYLGPGAGKQVQEGRIRRGDVAAIRAVVWYSDMRSSTRLADSMSGTEFLQTLNQYFESTANAVLQEGGEVLRFIGDAVLAIFPIDKKHRSEAACRRALRAASASEDKLLAVNRERVQRGEEAIDFGLGLHLGEVLFGNIGVPDRVEFSVIGPVANEVSRLESLTKSLKCRILVSESFARQLDLGWVSRGQFELRGVGSKVSVFSPPPSE